MDKGKADILINDQGPGQHRMDEKNPLVSIITIVLNDSAGLRKTIESVLQQSYDQIEYIVVDGGSTDNTLDVIREHEEKIDYWVSDPDEGISDAFNIGIRAAHGKYIGLINAGDWYQPDSVEQIMKVFMDAPETGVVCGALQFWDGEKREYLCHSAPQLLEKDMTITHPTCFVRADLYENYGTYDIAYKYAMDYRLLLGLKVGGEKFVTLPHVLANMAHSGISEERWREALEETHCARMELLPGSFYATRLYYLFVLYKRQIRVVLQKLGLEGPIAFYRRRLALVKKHKA